MFLACIIKHDAYRLISPQELRLICYRVFSNPDMSYVVESMGNTRIKVELNIDARSHEAPRELEILVYKQIQTADIDISVRQSAQVLRPSRAP
ncbi:hypothetical protein CHU98_g6595 [Xylaria longipes]|nr:hypothetical protein CHU98_g6595 [Xylaria longipes]